MATYKPVLRLKRKSDKEGIINIRVIETREVKHLSLKIKVPVKLWNDNANEVRKNEELDYKDINKKIEEKIKELKTFSAQEGYNQTLNNKASYISYFEYEFLTRITNPGSYLKYEMVLKKLKAFIKLKKKNDLLFSEIDSKLIHELNKYILKGCSTNTTNHYLKLIKQVLNKAVVENYYTYLRHPFLSITFQYDKVKKSALEKEEIQIILKHHIEETHLLFDTRNKFLTQLFLQGLRVSDLMLLRWNMIIGDNVEYVMFKTGNNMTVFINDLVWHIFIYQFKQLVKKEGIKLVYITHLENELKELESNRIEDLKQLGISSGFNLVPASVGNPELIDEIRITKKTIFANYQQQIKRIASDKRYKNQFIFNFLHDKDFSNIRNNDFTKITTEQYKYLKNKSIVYNTHLKQLQELVGLNTVLKSHLSRHSYAYMLLNEGISVYDIGQSLGHTGGLVVTEKYLKGLKTSNTANHNRHIAELFT